MKKDISFKRKPKTEAPAPTQEKTATDAPKDEAPKDEAPKRSKPSLPKRAPKQPKAPSNSGGGRHKQVVGLSIGASQLSAAVVVNNGSPKLVKAALHTLPPDVGVGADAPHS